MSFENARIMQDVVFVHETDYKEETRRAGKLIDYIGSYRPNYDAEYAKYLVKRFKLPAEKPVNKLSKGMQSVMDVIVGLSSRAPVTIFDEAYLGMDAPTRMLFYQEVLDDQEKHPRIFILSTHLVSEMDYLFDEVLILHKGELLLQEGYEELISRGLTITGEKALVDEFTKGMRIIGQQSLGNTKAVMLFEEQNDDIVKEANARGLDVGPVSLQNLFIYLTDEDGEGI